MKVICHNCGNEVEDKNFCPKCGTKIDVKKSRKQLLIGSIAFSIFIIAIGMVFYNKVIYPRKEIKDYLVETYNLSRKDIKIIHLASAPSKPVEYILTFDGGPVIITHKVKYKDFEFEVYDIDPNSPLHTFTDTYGGSIKYIDNVNNVKNQIENKLKSDNINSFVFASTDEFYKNKITSGYDKYNLLRFTVFIEELTKANSYSVNKSIFNIVNDYAKEQTLRYYYQIVVLNSKDYYEKIKEVDLEKYNNACNFGGYCLVDYKLLIEELNKQKTNDDNSGEVIEIYYALNDNSKGYRDFRPRGLSAELITDK